MDSLCLVDEDLLPNRLISPHFANKGQSFSFGVRPNSLQINQA